MYYLLLLFFVSITFCYTPLPGCQIFNDNHCKSTEIDTDPIYEQHAWYTPAEQDLDYIPSYQSYNKLTGYLHVQYNSNRSDALVSVKLFHRDKMTFKYFFNDVSSTEPSKLFTKSFDKDLQVVVVGSDNSKLILQPYHFIWNNVPIKDKRGDYRNGQKGSIVELFGWRYTDIMKECPKLAELGYLGVKLFPVTEHLMSFQPFNNVLNPWWVIYQPVSYKFVSRSGTFNELKHLVETCRKYNVRIYADAVINHMTGSGNDANKYHRIDNGGHCTEWSNKTTSNFNSPSPFYTQGFCYTYGNHTNLSPSNEFPAVPYRPIDFHCERPLNVWTDPLILDAGWLQGLTDLNTNHEYVQERIADYLTELISFGFSGFRIDAAKHIQPDNLASIFNKVKRNLGGSLPEDFISWLEILLGGESKMLLCEKDSGYNYAEYLVDVFRKYSFSPEDILKIKIWYSAYPKEPQVDCGKVDRRRFVVQNDDHDQQNPGSSSRDMGDAGCVLIKGCDIDKHRAFEVKLFSDPPGVLDNDNNYPIRLVLSSFYWSSENSIGMPDGLSDCKYCIKDCGGCLSYKLVDVCDKAYSSPYTCVHRDKSIVNAMRDWLKLESLSPIINSK